MKRHFLEKVAFLCIVETQAERLPAALAWPELREEFAQTPELNRAQVLAFYRSLEADVRPATIDWRIHELVRRGLLAAPAPAPAVATAPPAPIRGWPVPPPAIPAENPSVELAAALPVTPPTAHQPLRS